MARSFTLSFAAIDILLERLGLGPAPFPFEIPHHGRTRDERADVRAAVIAGLASRGLTELAESVVTLFAKPRTVITAFGKLDRGVPFFARICRSGKEALRAVGAGQSVHFEHIRPVEIVSSAVELLPEERAGAGEPVTLAPDSPGQTTVAGKKLRLGQFRITVAGRHEPDVFWFDTPDGRYSITASCAPDGPALTTISPADNDQITRLLSEQLAVLTGRSALDGLQQ